MLCLSLVYSYMYMYVYALIVCTLLLGGNKGIYLSIYLIVMQKVIKYFHGMVKLKEEIGLLNLVQKGCTVNKTDNA